MDVEGLGGLIAFVLGWLVAQAAKFIADLMSAKGALSFKEILHSATKSGGMPSGHTASFLAMTTYFGLTYGFRSSIFVLALCTAMIVIYDAVNVRYAVGEHGKVINIMLDESKQSKKKLRVVEGHTVPQVIVGGLIGITLGCLIAAIM